MPRRSTSTTSGQPATTGQGNTPSTPPQAPPQPMTPVAPPASSNSQPAPATSQPGQGTSTPPQPTRPAPPPPGQPLQPRRAAPPPPAGAAPATGQGTPGAGSSSRPAPRIGQRGGSGAPTPPRSTRSAPPPPGQSTPAPTSGSGTPAAGSAPGTPATGTGQGSHSSNGGPNPNAAPSSSQPGTNQPAPQQSTPRISAPGTGTRGEEIEREYVTNYKAKKADEERKLFGDQQSPGQGGGTPPAAPPQGQSGQPGTNQPAPATDPDNDHDAIMEGGPEGHWDRFHKVVDSDWFDLANNVVGDFGGVMGSASDLTGVYHDGEGRADRMDISSKVFNGIGSTVDAGVNTLGLISNSHKLHQAKKGNNQREKRNARFGVASSVFNTLGSYTNLGSYFTGLSDSKGATLGSGIAGSVGAGLGLIGSSIDLAGNVTEKYTQKRIANDTKDIRTKSQADISGSRAAYEDKRKAALGKSSLTDADRQALIQARKDQNTAKAEKLAMQYAEKNAIRQKSAANTSLIKGSLGLVGSALGFAGNVASTVLGNPFGINNKKSAAWTGFGASVGSMASKYLGMAIGATKGKSDETKAKSDKINDIKAYVDAERIKKVKEECAADQISDKEAQKIILARLGVKFDSDKLAGDSEPSDDDWTKGFNGLMLKRAKNIMDSNDASKQKMLAALRLDNTATLKEIAEALGAEF